jgi:hypothetical protein
MILYHRTSTEAAIAILRQGFRDATGRYMTDRVHTGVWLSDRPLDVNEGVAGETLLRISLNLSEKQIAEYEWIEEGKGYREWLIPSELVNTAGTAELESD